MLLALVFSFIGFVALASCRHGSQVGSLLCFVLLQPDGAATG